MKDKENALNDFIDMIEKSWTYSRMTQLEKGRFVGVMLSNDTISILKGNYENRWKILNVIYNIYLMGIGYSGFDWREDKEEL